MIAIRKLGMRFGEDVLFRDVDLTIGVRSRIGLVGPNGAGKTTLLRIISGELLPDTGTIERAKFATIGFLPQEVIRMKGKDLISEVATAFGDIIEAEQALESIRSDLERSDIDDDYRNELIERMGALQHHLENYDAFRMQSSIEKVLAGLGFREEQFRWRTEFFSGGWQMRIELAKLLLRQPSLLLLDEPTNHLDLDSLRWLETYLHEYEGSMIIVSHDRAFLDTMCLHIWDIANHDITVYTGNYSAYVQEKEQRKEILEAAYKNQQKQLKHTERFIERFRYKATKARQVQSRIKQLERIERIALEEGESSISFSFPSPPRSGSIVMECKGISKSYGETEVFRNLDITIERGDRIAFVGINGAGKSTLAKILAGTEPPTSGERIVGYNVTVGYFAQNQADELNVGLTPLETVESAAQGEIRKYARTLLGSFLFSGDDVFKRVGVLSGGEKSRLALAKMLVTPANFIILDEPTNHLDMRSKEVLRNALKNFEGTYIIVSHDRAFLDGIVNKVFAFAFGGSVTVFPGSVQEYIQKQEEDTGKLPGGGNSETPRIRSDKDRKRREAELRQLRYESTRKLLEKQGVVEREIHRLETLTADLEAKLTSTELYEKPEQIREINHAYSENKIQLEALYRDWESVSTQIEQIRSTYDTELRELKERDRNEI
jgi:ATP-binding cassette, subfamily F, member 3